MHVHGPIERARQCILGSLAMCALTVCAAPAQAQSWLVVPVAGSPDGLPAAQTIADHVVSALRAAGESVVDGDDARRDVERDLHREPPTPPEGLEASLLEAREAALRAVVRGELAGALDITSRALDASAPHIAALGRRTEAARALGDLCVLAVRSELGRGDEAAARHLAASCMHVQPDLFDETDHAAMAHHRFLHPPEVLELMASTRAALDATLVVQADALAPPGCVVRVNGRQLGTTPRVRARVAPGYYEVQIECEPGRAGRVLGVMVHARETRTLMIDVGLAEALRTPDRPVLVYRDSTSALRLSTHVAVLGRTTAATRVIAVISSEGQVALRAYSPNEGDQSAALLGEQIVPAGEIPTITSIRALSAPPVVTIPRVDLSVVSAPQAAPGGLRLHVSGEHPGLTLYLAAPDTRSDWREEPFYRVRPGQFELMCAAPCTREGVAGTFAFGVADGNGRPRRVDEPPVELTGDVWVRMRHDDRDGMRAVGWVLQVLGLVPVAGIIPATMEDWLGWPDGTWVGIGLGTFAVFFAVGFFMAMTADVFHVDVSSAPPEAVTPEPTSHTDAGTPEQRPRRRARREVDDF